MINVIIAEDHDLMRQTICSFINAIPNYHVACVAKNGYDLLLNLHKLKISPDIALIDVNMPILDGIQITKILHDHFSKINVLGISLQSDSNFVTDMLFAGAKGFLSKNNMDIYLSKALETIVLGEVFIEPYYESYLSNYLQKAQMPVDESGKFKFTKRQIFYLQLNASELTYKDISIIMHVSEKSIHNYHDSIKEKTGVSSRLGQALFAFKFGIINSIRKNINFLGD